MSKKSSISGSLSTNGRSFRPLQKNKDPKAESYSKYLYVSGYKSLVPDTTNPSNEDSDEYLFSQASILLRNIFEKFGIIDSIEFIPNRTYCFICFNSAESARAAFSYYNSTSISKNELKVRYATEELENEDESQPIPEPSDCPCSYATVTEDGRVEVLKSLEKQCIHVILDENGGNESAAVDIFLDFVSPEEESRLLDELAGRDGPWSSSALSRRVQHYGHTFNYRTLMLDYSKNTPPLPESCVDLAHRISTTYPNPNPGEGPGEVVLDQLTLNEYLPGQGIAAHTDTKSCFGPSIFILSLGSAVVMRLALDEDKTRQVLLPARSLLALRGAARSQWTHGISSRKMDKVGGRLLARGRRVSLTFRQALRPGPIPPECLRSGRLEQDHVIQVYDAIAVHWNHTRGLRKVYWQRVKSFIEALPPGSVLADVGSGDGKYLILDTAPPPGPAQGSSVRSQGVVSLGCDRSLRLLEVSREPLRHESLACDAVRLPYRDRCFDAALCVAVLHHLASPERRYAAIAELVRITRDGGQVLLQAWAQEQDPLSKRVFAEQDTLVPWTLPARFQLPTPEAPPAEQVLQRYCHVFRQGELENLCSAVPDCRLEESGWERGNWFVRLRVARAQGSIAVAEGPQHSLPALATRSAPRMTDYVG